MLEIITIKMLIKYKYLQRENNQNIQINRLLLKIKY